MRIFSSSLWALLALFVLLVSTQNEGEEGWQPDNEYPPGEDGQCSCFGLDYADGGSYLINGNSDDDFSFTSVFEGCFDAIITPVLVSPDAVGYECSPIDALEDGVEQASSCPVSYSEMIDGTWIIVLDVPEYDFTVQRQFQVVMNREEVNTVVVTVTPTEYVGVTSTVAGETVTSWVAETETLYEEPEVITGDCYDETDTVVQYIPGPTTKIVSEVARWSTAGVVTQYYFTTVTEYAYCHWPATPTKDKPQPTRTLRPTKTTVKSTARPSTTRRASTSSLRLSTRITTLPTRTSTRPPTPTAPVITTVTRKRTSSSTRRPTTSTRRTTTRGTIISTATRPRTSTTPRPSTTRRVSTAITTITTRQPPRSSTTNRPVISSVVTTRRTTASTRRTTAPTRRITTSNRPITTATTRRTTVDPPRTTVTTRRTTATTNRPITTVITTRITTLNPPRTTTTRRQTTTQLPPGGIVTTTIRTGRPLDPPAQTTRRVTTTAKPPSPSSRQQQPTSRQQQPTSRQQQPTSRAQPTSRQQQPTSRQQQPTSRQQQPTSRQGGGGSGGGGQQPPRTTQRPQPTPTRGGGGGSGGGGGRTSRRPGEYDDFVPEITVAPAPEAVARRAPLAAHLADVTSTVYDTNTVTQTVVEIEEEDTSTEYNFFTTTTTFHPPAQTVCDAETTVTLFWQGPPRTDYEIMYTTYYTWATVWVGQTQISTSTDYPAMTRCYSGGGWYGP